MKAEKAHAAVWDDAAMEDLESIYGLCCSSFYEHCANCTLIFLLFIQGFKWVCMWQNKVFQILWRAQTLLLLLQLLWIPPARQLIGSNNKLCCFKPLTNMPPNSIVRASQEMYLHADTHALMIVHAF